MDLNARDEVNRICKEKQDLVQQACASLACGIEEFKDMLYQAFSSFSASTNKLAISIEQAAASLREVCVKLNELQKERENQAEQVRQRTWPEQGLPSVRRLLGAQRSLLHAERARARLGYCRAVQFHRMLRPRIC